MIDRSGKRLRIGDRVVPAHYMGHAYFRDIDAEVESEPNRSGMMLIRAISSPDERVRVGQSIAVYERELVKVQEG